MIRNIVNRLAAEKEAQIAAAAHPEALDEHALHTPQGLRLALKRRTINSMMMKALRNEGYDQVAQNFRFTQRGEP